MYTLYMYIRKKNIARTLARDKAISRFFFSNLQNEILQRNAINPLCLFEIV